ncbi:GerAB/ArcD/ProY family transporter [Alkaliphilus hydrothermalis]|uniref:Spore germination protein KB n=1 Tax=Alkaliphilus hydrothermalis TaxID=1482730 RepID=A0ABS2NS93_9FIRM|nr:endospore germination permease [Alkaliphilus hydrothermalis]MBM7615808.1 spore germination protein KB [Alkaliphilus hydrothermalis]
MIKNQQLSSYQLCLAIVAFIFGSVAIFSPVLSAQQDAWLAHVIGWGGGFLLISLYAGIALLNPNMTLIDVLKSHFGEYLGSIIGLLYVWYGLHIASLILHSFSEFMVSVNYTETPTVFIVISVLIPIFYGLRKGLEVCIRVNQMSMIFLVATLLLTILLSIPLFDLGHLLPFLEFGFKPILKGGLHLTAFPFGETVLLLMIFPCLKKQKDLLKISNLAVFIAGLLLLLNLLKDLLILGPDIMSRHLFPTYMSVSMIPQAVLEPIVSANLLISSGFQALLCIFAALVGIAQIFGLDDYKPLVLPVVAFVASLSFWVHESYPEAFTWSVKYWTIYSIPFQLIIPVILFGLSLIKKNKKWTVNT